jgi:hypothetical protein
VHHQFGPRLPFFQVDDGKLIVMLLENAALETAGGRQGRTSYGVEDIEDFLSLSRNLTLPIIVPTLETR